MLVKTTLTQPGVQKLHYKIIIKACSI